MIDGCLATTGLALDLTWLQPGTARSLGCLNELDRLRGGKHRQLADLKLRHRRRTRAEDRVRAARATGLRNLPLHHTAQNQIWLEIVQTALDLLAWMPMLALTGPARTREPRRLRLRLLHTAGRLITTGRRHILRLPAHWP